MEIILYLSIAVIAIAFFILVIFLIKTLKSLQKTLDSVSHTLNGLEGQLQGVTKETTELLKKTNALAEDIKEKSVKLNSVVDAVKDVGTSIQKFNRSLEGVTEKVIHQVDTNQERISQVVQWGQVFMELRDRWSQRKQKNSQEQKNATEYIEKKFRNERDFDRA
ncbi:MAG TPA: DUF948 domain-containing protein [Bacillus sp. (in: firmicutes)]|uniref:DUF948 domain-containing protein n=1 Tax=Bacillus litorisediminis TaxID=2922713 RepID=UPI001FACBA37|nr:DUF948 domain-containing protein [Bacillus litorisediminis]HWO75452.1 DUF948 domain-containing protein [Bacillus sp. (in: firmicutes)]